MGGFVIWHSDLVCSGGRACARRPDRVPMRAAVRVRGARGRIFERAAPAPPRLCPGVPPGQGRIKACMKAHVTELSAPCFDAIMKAVAAEKEPG